MRIQTLASLAAACAAATAPLALARVSAPQGEPSSGRGYVAVKAGTIHLVEEGKVLSHGALLLKGGRIQAVGTDLAVPPDARVVDYGPDAVIVPGLFAADSNLGTGMAAERTAEPGLRALDNFDFYSKNASAPAFFEKKSKLSSARRPGSAVRSAAMPVPRLLSAAKRPGTMTASP